MKVFLEKPLVACRSEILHPIFARETYIIITATPPFIGNLEGLQHYFSHSCIIIVVIIILLPCRREGPLNVSNTIKHHFHDKYISKSPNSVTSPISIIYSTSKCDLEIISLLQKDNFWFQGRLSGFISTKIPLSSIHIEA